MKSRNWFLRLGIRVYAVADCCTFFVISPLSLRSTGIGGPVWGLAERCVKQAIDGPSEK